MVSTKTPTPWAVVPIELFEGGEGIEVRAANGEAVASNQTYYPTALDPDNVHIIAAAPDILAALEDIIDFYAGIIEERAGCEETNAARSAIKKAKGITS